MLHDLRGTYIRRDDDSFRRPVLKIAAVTLLSFLLSCLLLWASVEYGTMEKLEDGPALFEP